jgi:hypothetical protein
MTLKAAAARVAHGAGSAAIVYHYVREWTTGIPIAGRESPICH